MDESSGARRCGISAPWARACGSAREPGPRPTYSSARRPLHSPHSARRWPGSWPPSVDVVILSLPALPADVEVVVDGPPRCRRRRAGGCDRDTPPAVATFSSRLAENFFSEPQASYLDAHGRGVAGAEAGAPLKIMAGGDVAAFERARPVLDLLAPHCGAVAAAGHADEDGAQPRSRPRLMAEIESLARRRKRTRARVSRGARARRVAALPARRLTVASRSVRAHARRQGLDVAMRLATERGVPVPVAGATVQAIRHGARNGRRRRRPDGGLGVVERWNDVRLDGSEGERT